MFEFNHESKELIERYIEDGLLDEAIIMPLWKARSKTKILEPFQNNFRKDDNIRNKIINDSWMEQAKINPEINILSQILANDGIIVSKDIVDGKLLTEWIINRRSEELRDKGFIEILYMKKKKIFMIHPKMMRRE